MKEEKAKRILTKTGYTTELEKHEVLFYIENLQSQLKAKEETMNELKKWLKEETKLYWNTDILEKMQELEILSKGENK